MEIGLRLIICQASSAGNSKLVDDFLSYHLFNQAVKSRHPLSAMTKYPQQAIPA